MIFFLLFPEIQRVGEKDKLMKKIPKVCYAYWGNTVLPYLRYMCFKSFLQFNPDWKLVLYTPVQLTRTQSWLTNENKQVVNTIDYSDRLDALGVEVRTWNMEAVGYGNDIPEVTKSDILRLHLLSTVGGLWTDSDIIYFRPLSHALPSTGHEAYFCYRRGGPTQEDNQKNGPKYHSIGFLASAPNNSDYKVLWNNRPVTINEAEYQAIGSPFYGTLINDAWLSVRQDTIYNVDIQLVYPSRALPGMWSPAQSYVGQVHDVSIGWHWYAGHPHSGNMQNVVTEQTCAFHDNIICWIVGRINAGLPVHRGCPIS